MSLIDAQPRPEEVELKLSIASDSARIMARREVGSAPVRPVETIYYDTPKRRLQAAGVSLRLRRDGETWSQSIKASSGFSRFEQERPLRGGLPDFSLLEGTPLASLVGADGGLLPVFVTRVNRRTRKRALNDGRIEFSLDEGEVIAKGRSWPILELELELKGGEPRTLFDAGRRLAEDADFVPDFMSKAERGFALADGMLGAPVHFGTHPLDPDQGAAEAFRGLARRCLRHLALNAELIAGGARLEATHQAHTGLRRLRVAIDLFGGLLDAGWSGKVKDELRWLTGELGPVRDLDVMIEEVFRRRAHEIADRAAAAQFGRVLLAAQESAHVRARAALAAPRFRLLLLEMARRIETGSRQESIVEAADPPIADFVGMALGRLHKNLVRRLKALEWDDVRARHKARISTKAMRYASEFFVGLGPRDRANLYRPFLKALMRLHDGLGGLNDLAVAERSTPTLLTGQTRDVTFAAGLIIGREAAATDKRISRTRRDVRAFKRLPAWW